MAKDDDEIIRNDRQAWIYVIELAANMLAGATGDEWCYRDDEASERRLGKAQKRLVAELDARAKKLRRGKRTR